MVSEDSANLGCVVQFYIKHVPCELRMRKLPLLVDTPSWRDLAESGHQEELMKRSRFTEQQIFAILKEAEAGGSVKDVCRRW